jgi:hypothetical protein
MFSNTGYGFGTLLVEPGSLRIRLAPVTAMLLGAVLGMKRITSHRGGSVEVFCAGIGPPLHVWRNTGVVVRHRDGAAVVQLAAWDRRRLLARLDEAGFGVVRHDTVADVGHRAIRRRR